MKLPRIASFTCRQPGEVGARRRRLAVAAFALSLGIADPPASIPAFGQNAAVVARDISATLISSTTHPVPAGFGADAQFLIHTMPSITGEATRASTLLFVPHGAPPAGGWPVVAWAHGTTTPGQRTCAPSLSPELDGGLTRDGFESDYVFQIGQLVNAGFAVVAPDLEGLGPVATVSYPYFSAASLARSLIAGIQASRRAAPSLSDRYAVVGHSEGGHAVLGVEAHAAEAPELILVGNVALAPYVAVAAHAESFGRMARTTTDETAAQSARVMEQFQVALMTVGLIVQSPGFDADAVMGRDLAGALPAFRAQCSVGAIAVIDNAIRARGASFEGLRPGWNTDAHMSAFLAANDLAMMPGLTLRRPTLIVQGTVDPTVLEPLVTRFAEMLRATGAPVTYTLYPDADHFTILRQADAEVIAFLRERFSH